MAWAQIEVESNRVTRIAMPQQGWHANISFARPATEMVREVN